MPISQEAAMHAHPQWFRTSLVVLILTTALSACTNDLEPPSEPEVNGFERPTADVLGIEGELLGNVYDGSGSSTATDLYFELVPFDNQRQRFLYAAVRGQESGVVNIDAETDEVTDDVASVDGRGIDVAIHPAGDLLWLTTHDDDPAQPTPSLLIDPATMEIIESFPRPVPEGTETRWVLAATFHPNGKLLYQARDDDIDVYLIR